MIKRKHGREGGREGGIYMSGYGDAIRFGVWYDDAMRHRENKSPRRT